MNNELKEIKKIYGEEMMHLCRELFPTILEKEGLLLKMLENNLAPTHSFVKDIKEHGYKDDFRNWIYSLLGNKKIALKETDKTPFELMKEVGYTLKECFTESDIQSYKKYYDVGEELCTFNGGRLDRCFVFFAVKDNVDEIKRFSNPEREDAYGTSVISIQFSRERPNFISIKNRYNHTVDNPDATFYNDLEKIIPGLTRSFEKKYDYQITTPPTKEERFLTNVLQYVKAKDGKYYRYNAEHDAIYYCDNNMVIKDGIPMDIHEYLEKEKNESYLLIEDNLIDFKNKTIKCLSDKNSSFIRSINCVGNIKNFEVRKKDSNRLITINYENGKQVEIEINKSNAIVGYKNHHIKTIGKNFLPNNREMEYFDTPNVRVIKEKFLERTKKLKSISFPNAIKIENNFLTYNETVSSVYLPLVEFVGDFFMYSNKELRSIDLPKVAFIGDNFFTFNEIITRVSFPELLCVRDSFFCHAENIDYLYLPKIKIIGRRFIPNCYKLKKVYLPETIEIGDGFMTEYSPGVEEIYLPKAVVIGKDFAKQVGNVKKVFLPNAKSIGSGCLYYASDIEEMCLPEAEDLGEFFMYSCYNLKRLLLPKAKEIPDRTLHDNTHLEYLYCPVAERVGERVLYYNDSIEIIDFSNVKSIKHCLLYKNKKIRDIFAPNLEEIEDQQSVYVENILDLPQRKVKVLKTVA